MKAGWLAELLLLQMLQAYYVAPKETQIEAVSKPERGHVKRINLLTQTDLSLVP